MAYQQTNILVLGSGLAGIVTDLRGQLIASDGASVGSAISTGFVELGDGFYLHAYSSPDTTEVAIKYYRQSTGDVLAVTLSEAKAQSVYEGVLAIGSGNVTVASPVTASGKVTVYSGFDMVDALRLTFTEPSGSTWPTDLTDIDVHMRMKTGQGTATVTVDIEGEVLVATGSSKVIRFAPTASETEPLTTDLNGAYDLYAIVDETEVPLVVGGKLVVRDRIPE